MQNDLVEKEIESCKNSSKRFLELKKKLRLNPDVVNCNEQDIISALQVAFVEKIILTQYCIENKRIDAYLSHTNLEQKLMNIIMKAEVLIMKKVDN